MYNNMEKAIMALYNNPTLQQMRRLQEEIDILNNMAYPMEELTALINANITKAIAKPELKVIQEWLSNQNMINELSKTASLEDALKIFGNNVKLGVSRIVSIDNSANDQLLLNTYSEDASEEEKEEIKDVNNKIITEILKPTSEIVVPNKDMSKIIVLPINDDVLKYLSDNTEELHKLTGTQFEDVMAEVYSRLGYEVTQTKKTRDGGKDLIIKIPNSLGDFVYYVECKKYSQTNPVGIGIVKNLVGTLSVDKVNGGIIATTSQFTKDAREFILNNNMQYQIQMHDYDKVQQLLKQAVQTKRNY